MGGELMSLYLGEAPSEQLHLASWEAEAWLMCFLTRCVYEGVPAVRAHSSLSAKTETTL